MRLPFGLPVVRDGFVDGEKNRTHAYDGGDHYDDFRYCKAFSDEVSFSS